MPLEIKGWLILCPRKTGSQSIAKAVHHNRGRLIGEPHGPRPTSWKGPTIGLIRDPWNRHASLWAHQTRWGREVRSFQQALIEATNQDAYITELLEVFQGGVDFFIPTDRLTEGIHEILGIEIQHRHRNPEGLDYSSWYTPELSERIRSSQGEIIEAFKWEAWKNSPRPFYPGRTWSAL